LSQGSDSVGSRIIYAWLHSTEVTVFEHCYHFLLWNIHYLGRNYFLLGFFRSTGHDGDVL